MKHETEPPDRVLAKALQAAWLPRVSNGFFFRAESFFSLATYIDEKAAPRDDGPLHQMSHGESFLSLFKDQLGGGRASMYLLDEPEAALSPARQLVFTCLMRRWEEEGNVQAIIVTHAPILMAYPGARLLEFRRGRIRQVEFEETEHYQVMRSFFSRPARLSRRHHRRRGMIAPSPPIESPHPEERFRCGEIASRRMGRKLDDDRRDPLHRSMQRRQLLCRHDAHRP